MKSLKLICAVLVAAFFIMPIEARDIILEFKAAYFLPTSSAFKDIYQNGGALYGPEITFQLCDESNWYGFASIDYLQKTGCSQGLGDETKVSLLPLAIGAKYLYPVKCDCLDVYVGLGFQPTQIQTTNCSAFVIPKQTQWSFGGIAKIGAYWYIADRWALDFFIDYSFAQTSCKDSCQLSTDTIISPIKVDVSGAVFGVGLGYCF